MFCCYVVYFSLFSFKKRLTKNFVFPFRNVSLKTGAATSQPPNHVLFGETLNASLRVSKEFLNVITVKSNRHAILNYLSIKCLLNSLLGLTTKKDQRFTLLSLCEGNPQVTGSCSAQRNSKTENVSIWWCHSVNTLRSGDKNASVNRVIIG